MDQELAKIVNQAMAAKSADGGIDLNFVRDDNHLVTVIVEIDGQEHKHLLKPLVELYGSGIEGNTMDPASPEYMPLCLAIEESILRHFKAHRWLTDAKVSLALSRLAINPEVDPGEDGLTRDISDELRLLLSMNNYSRRDVQRAIRKIAKSVQRHSRDEGRVGYLTFIERYLL